MEDYVLFTPMVAYENDHLQNILENGTPLLEEGGNFLKMQRDRVFEEGLYESIKINSS